MLLRRTKAGLLSAQQEQKQQQRPPERQGPGQGQAGIPHSEHCTTTSPLVSNGAMVMVSSAFKAGSGAGAINASGVAGAGGGVAGGGVAGGGVAGGGGSDLWIPPKQVDVVLVQMSAQEKTFYSALYSRYGIETLAHTQLQ